MSQDTRTERTGELYVTDCDRVLAELGVRTAQNKKDGAAPSTPPFPFLLYFSLVADRELNRLPLR